LIGRKANRFHVTAAEKNRDDLNIRHAFRMNVFNRFLGSAKIRSGGNLPSPGARMLEIQSGFPVLKKNLHAPASLGESPHFNIG
jgi:hypothetical protein